jgi:hypothetical protein
LPSPSPLWLILLTSKFKFPIFRFIIAMVWNNLVALSAYITFVSTSSTNFGVLICVIVFLDSFVDDPISCTNMFFSPYSNGCPFVDHGLLIDNSSSSGLNYLNPSFGRVTKAKGLQGCGSRESPRVTSHTPGSVGKCEGVNPHTPKATPTLEDGISVDFRNFRERFQGSKLNDLWRSLYYWKSSWNVNV